MRVGLLIYGSLETISGGYLYDRKLVEHLQRQGDSVEVISLPWRNYARHLTDNFSAELTRRLRNLRGDILLQDELNHPSLFWTNHRLQNKLPFPRVTIVHHLRCREQRPDWLNRFYRFIEKAYLSGVSGFIFNSQTTCQAVKEVWAGANQIPSIIAYPAGDRLKPEIQEAEITGRTLQPGPLRLLFLGNLIERKGLHTLLEALSRLPLPGWKLAVAGRMDVDPGYTRRVQRLTIRCGIQKEVVFYGPLADSHLAALMRSSHVLAVPSSYEGYGIAYLEGMGFGLPAIGAKAGGAGEIITHGEDGFLVQPDDSVTLAQQLALLINDRQHLLEMSLAARRRFLAQPTWEQTGMRIRNFLESFLSSPVS
jgi:glycosyltransferase involved in cell wall biosynthesis